VKCWGAEEKGNAPVRGAWGAQGHLASGSQLILRGHSTLASFYLSVSAARTQSVQYDSISTLRRYEFQLWSPLVFLDGNKGRHNPCGEDESDRSCT
jgi:hypothetical protein